MTNGQSSEDLPFDADGLALHLLRGTQAAALACMPWVGRGDKNAADGAAVEAMREVLGNVPGRGEVLIGEGEKDDAPMLYRGEEIGTGHGPAFELAVDPLEGTNYAATGTEGSIAVVAASPKGSMCTTSGFYMDKVVVGPAAVGAVEIDAPVEDKLRAVAKALGKPVEDITAVVLDKPRHEELIDAVRDLGASVIAIPDGDVMGSLRVLVPGGGVDIALGVGGTPEGVLTACAVKALGGDMQGRLAPQDDDEREKIKADGVDPNQVLGLDDLVSGEDCVFVATAVTSTVFLPAPEKTPGGWKLGSLVVTPRHPSLFVTAVLSDEAAEGPTES
ncbi:MAG TPA: class II fructose-bisphosphatase [Acidimicrobiales bacterium]|nr:class II fructose-bisphosphatase [Acidimicrobiales bacterium]